MLHQQCPSGPPPLGANRRARHVRAFQNRAGPLISQGLGFILIPPAQRLVALGMVFGYNSGIGSDVPGSEPPAPRQECRILWKAGFHEQVREEP